MADLGRTPCWNAGEQSQGTTPAPEVLAALSRIESESHAATAHRTPTGDAGEIRTGRTEGDPAANRRGATGLFFAWPRFETPLLLPRKEKTLDIVGIAAILCCTFRDRSPIGPGLFPSALVLLGVYAVENRAHCTWPENLARSPG
jgi:hypothetical protein